MKLTDLVRNILEESNIQSDKDTSFGQSISPKTILSHSLLSRIFHIARSSIRYQSIQEQKDILISTSLRSVHEEHPWYGHRRLSWSLGWSYKRTRRLMKKLNIFALIKKQKNWIKPWDQHQEDMHGKEIQTTTGKSKIQNYLSKLSPIAPNIVWRSDFTHIIFSGIHIYLATVLDDYTKEILWYALSYHHTKELILTAIRDAITKTGGILPEYFHSDQGSEYTSYTVLEFLQLCNILISMSNKWSPWQNWAQESYYGKLKLELWPTKDYECIEALILAIHRQIYYYNHKRLHTRLRDTPIWFHLKYEQKMEILLSQNPHLETIWECMKMKESSGLKK